MDKKTPAKQFAGQHDDEVVELVFRQHPIVMRHFFLAAALILIIGVLPFSLWPYNSWSWKLALGAFVVAGLVFLYRFISWYYSVYIVTDQRLIQIKQNGFFDRRVADISHSKIQSVNYEIKGFEATMFRFGTIIVQTYVGDMTLRFIHDPAEVQQMLVRMIRNVKPVDISEVEGTNEGEVHA